MIEESKRLKCDVCGKTSDWIIIKDQPDAKASNSDWRQFNFSPSWQTKYQPKDYCSKECAIKDLEKQYTDASV